MTRPTAVIEDSRCMSCAEVDITRWLAETPAQEIIDVALTDWGDSSPAEVIVASYRTEPGVRGVLDTIEACLGDRDAPRLRCVVDGGLAMEWLDDNRPDVAAQIRNSLAED